MSLAFKYNPETNRIESDDTEIYIEVFGRRREGPFEAVLMYRSRKIGLAMETERSADDRLTDWFIEDVYTSIFRHGEDGKLKLYCSGGKFEDKKEMYKILNIIADAFLAYNATNEPPKQNLTVSISNNLHPRIHNGELIK